MCSWICVIGTEWVCDGVCTCPEEEACAAPTTPGASGDRKTSPCLPLGTGGGA